MSKELDDIISSASLKVKKAKSPKVKAQKRRWLDDMTTCHYRVKVYNKTPRLYATPEELVKLGIPECIIDKRNEQGFISMGCVEEPEKFLNALKAKVDALTVVK